MCGARHRQRPKCMGVDEATSAGDMETDALIRAYPREFQDATLIVIGTALSTSPTRPHPRHAATAGAGVRRARKLMRPRARRSQERWVVESAKGRRWRMCIIGRGGGEGEGDKAARKGLNQEEKEWPAIIPNLDGTSLSP